MRYLMYIRQRPQNSHCRYSAALPQYPRLGTGGLPESRVSGEGSICTFGTFPSRLSSPGTRLSLFLGINAVLSSNKPSECYIMNFPLLFSSTYSVIHCAIPALPRSMLNCLENVTVLALLTSSSAAQWHENRWVDERRGEDRYTFTTHPLKTGSKVDTTSPPVMGQVQQDTFFPMETVRNRC
ncbi:hypothetical protein ACRALDRAFT_207391 [Sodiomyces alcalophilus JCM 7366]|uniref:uncharacterized protein n=1 Tax=Sodiomyces alcalophilus JCM 7366 TaxID=591952 RepID=UPI0039B567F6